MTDEQILQHLGQRPDEAVTVSGRDYVYNGWLVSVFRKRKGACRCVVEDRHGRLFIHNANQLSQGAILQEVNYERSIKTLGFPTRIVNALINSHADSIGDLIALSRYDLMCMSNFGKTSLRQVEQTLATFGLRLREPQ